jgi:hypothetical protein
MECPHTEGYISRTLIFQEDLILFPEQFVYKRYLYIFNGNYLAKRWQNTIILSDLSFIHHVIRLNNYQSLFQYT